MLTRKLLPAVLGLVLPIAAMTAAPMLAHAAHTEHASHTHTTTKRMPGTSHAHRSATHRTTHASVHKVSHKTTHRKSPA